DVQKLRDGVRRDLENELNYSQNRVVRNQLIAALMNKVNFELPQSAVESETRNVVYDLVRENQKRGVPREMIEQEKDRIYSAATQNAKDRVKVSFLLRKIAEKEDIKVSQEEVLRRIQTMAQMYQIPPEKFIKDLQKRNGFVEIYDQLASEKTIEFLQQNAKVEDVPPGTL